MEMVGQKLTLEIAGTMVLQNFSLTAMKLLQQEEVKSM
jgi:hypothetical protein